jgi:single-strand DNA-binding protein
MSANITIEGRLGSDPELRFTKTGKSVASLSVVTSKSSKGADGKWEESETTWYSVDAWETLGECAVESLRKGQAVIITGRLYSEKITTKEGKEILLLKVRAYNIGPSLKRDKWEHRGKADAPAPQQAAENPWSDDIPPF